MLVAMVANPHSRKSSLSRGLCLWKVGSHEQHRVKSIHNRHLKVYM